MRKTIRHIDRAIKKLYNISSPYRAENFLLKAPPPLREHKKVASSDLLGALYVRDLEIGIDASDISIGIYLNPAVTQELTTFAKWESQWNGPRLRAFTVATEEISHFNYLLYNAHRKRPVSQFELELQGEIDKFLMVYFARVLRTRNLEKNFEAIFEVLYSRFRLASHLNEAERVRYLDANNYAKKFIRRLKADLCEKGNLDNALKTVRKFYRMDLAAKMGWLHIRIR